MSGQKSVSSLCPLDCPDACSLDVTVKEGKVLHIEGNHRNPLTQGFICGKVRHLPEVLYGSDRVSEPLMRRGRKGSGDFVPVSWDDALDTICSRFEAIIRKDGPEAILPVSYGGSNGYLTSGSCDARFFGRMGAARLVRTLCAAPSGKAQGGMYGHMPGVALQDYAYARLIVLWGCNPASSGVHLVPHIQLARQQGAKLVVIDPRQTPLTRDADIHLRVKPGADLPLALAMHRWIHEQRVYDSRFMKRWCTGAEDLWRSAEPWTLERAARATGLEPETMEAFFALYADEARSVIRCGWGPERNRNGGSAIAAILALPAVMGRFGVRGAGFTMSNSKAWDLSAAQGARAPVSSARAFNINRLGQRLLDATPPIKGLFVFNANPVATFPAQEKVRQGLMREDLFTVVYDPFMTDTAKLADLVLPSTTFLEHFELHRGYGAYVLQSSKPAAEPYAKARPNYEIFSLLSRKMGLYKPGDPEDPEALQDAIVATSADAWRLKRELAENGIATPSFGASPVLFVDVAPRTLDGKVHLFDDTSNHQSPKGLYTFLPPDPAMEKWPLSLISPSSTRSTSSSFAQRSGRKARVRIHPEDAKARKLEDGQNIRMFNHLGEVVCRCKVSDTVRPGVVSLSKGLWLRHCNNKATSNALVDDTLTDLGDGACFNDARVEVEAWMP